MRWVALVLAAFVVTACTRAAPGITVVGPTWRATVATVPWPPRGIAPHRLIVTFDDREVRGPVQLQMRMLGMSHEMVRVPLQVTAPGRFEGRAAFEMAGTWQLTLTAGTPPAQGAASVTVQP